MAPLTPGDALPRRGVQPVWSVGIRLLHWTLALSMITSFLTHEGAGKLHEYSGYLALAAASLRLLMGLVGSGYWRFSQFVRGVAYTLRYARNVKNHSEARYLGHNPLGGWMVLLLLADAVAAGLTGWLFTTDRFWGMAWLEELHSVFGNLLLPLLLLHLAGVVFTSLRHRENLVASMLHGRKAAAGPQDIK
jgi:cytochrome b